MWWLAVLPIIGGTADTVDTAVVEVVIAGGQCSGVLVAPRVVITAAHCAKPGPGGTAGGAQIIDTWIDRYDDGTVDHDLAALRLGSDLALPLAIAAPALGGAIRLVGFGEDGSGGRGTRHQVAATISALRVRSLEAGAQGATTCIGDSGGAALDANGALVGIVSAGNATCTSAAELVRPDSEPQLAEVIAAWSGTAQAPCGFDGTCSAACPAVDLDCPLGDGPGATCTAATACESRVCVAAPEGGLQFCSASCATAADCPAPLAACDGSHCSYGGTTPGIVGTACTADADCRSGLCDHDAGICTAPCDGDACPASFTCAPVRDVYACTKNSGCSIAGEPPLWPLAALFALRRRRRPLQSRAAS